MTFYQQWAEARKNNRDDFQYIQRFLDYDMDSTKPLLHGSKEEIIQIVQFLLSIPVDNMISTIDHEYVFSSKDIFQYSKLHDAIVTICNMLEFEHKQLSFINAGKLITHAQNELACIKYGENHIKLAASLSFVNLEKDLHERNTKASITTLGSVSTTLDDQTRYELVRRLAIRNSFVKSLIYNAKTNTVEYKNLASTVLSGQTITRRKHNVEIIVKLILGEHPIKCNIRW